MCSAVCRETGVEEDSGGRWEQGGEGRKVNGG